MDNKILIEPIINGKTHGFAIQAEVFSFDLKVTNISESPSPKFKINRVFFNSADGKNLGDDFSGKSFFVDVLNPNESKIINVGKNGQFLYGLVDVRASVAPEDQAVQIKFMQKNPCTKEICETSGNNYWIDFFYIKSISEHGQERTNMWMMILTLVIAFSTLIQLAVLFMPFFQKYL